jgi:hypothetical protein
MYDTGVSKKTILIITVPAVLLVALLVRDWVGPSDGGGVSDEWYEEFCSACDEIDEDGRKCGCDPTVAFQRTLLCTIDRRVFESSCHKVGMSLDDGNSEIGTCVERVRKSNPDLLEKLSPPSDKQWSAYRSRCSLTKLTPAEESVMRIHQQLLTLSIDYERLRLMAEPAVEEQLSIQDRAFEIGRELDEVGDSDELSMVYRIGRLQDLATAAIVVAELLEPEERVPFATNAVRYAEAGLELVDWLRQPVQKKNERENQELQAVNDNEDRERLRALLLHAHSILALSTGTGFCEVGQLGTSLNSEFPAYYRKQIANGNTRSISQALERARKDCDES